MGTNDAGLFTGLALGYGIRKLGEGEVRVSNSGCSGIRPLYQWDYILPSFLRLVSKPAGQSVSALPSIFIFEHDLF